MVRERLATEVVPRYYRLPAPEDFVLRSHLIPVTSALVGHQYLNVNPSNFMVMNNSFQNLLSGAVLELISRVSYVRTL
ncbi:Trans-prenyltransferase [Trichinella pseudospiralis]